MAQSKGSAEASSNEETKTKLVPRKKLQTVPDLLSNGAEDATKGESLASKLVWMGFLLLLFYLSFELFLKLHEKDPGAGAGEGGSSEL